MPPNVRYPVFHKLREKAQLPATGRVDARGALLWYATQLRLQQRAQAISYVHGVANLFHKLREKAQLPATGRVDARGALLWYATQLRLQQRAQAIADGASHPIRPALRQVIHQAADDRERWQQAAGDWRQLRLIAMTAIERGKVFARGAYDADTCAPFPPRGLLPLHQAKKCVRNKLPGGGPDGTAPDGGNALALQSFPGEESDETGSPPLDIKIDTIERPCWVWAFEAAKPEKKVSLTPQGAPLETVLALGDKQFRNYLEYLAYFHQTWSRFGELRRVLHGPLDKDRVLGPYELEHAAQILLGGVGSDPADAAIKSLASDGHGHGGGGGGGGGGARTLFGLVTYVATKELELMRKRDEKAQKRSARVRGNRALKTQEEEKQGESSRSKALSKEQALKALAKEQEKRREAAAGVSGGGAGGSSNTSSLREQMSGGPGGISPGARSAAGSLMASVEVLPGAAAAGGMGGGGGLGWYRVRQTVKVQRDHDEELDEVVDHAAVLLLNASVSSSSAGTSVGDGSKPKIKVGSSDRRVRSAQKLETLRQSTGMTLQAGEIIQVLERRQGQRRAKTGSGGGAAVHYVRFSGGWIASPDDGSVLVPCNEPSSANASQSTSPTARAAAAATATTAAWRPSVSGSREQQAAALQAHHVNGQEDWSHGPYSHRTRAPALPAHTGVANAAEQEARDKLLAELESWDDAAVRRWLQRKGLAKLSKPLADEGFNGRGLAALYRITHTNAAAAAAAAAAPGSGAGSGAGTDVAMALGAEYQRLFRAKVSARLAENSGDGGAATATATVTESMWRNFDASLQELCGEGVIDRLTRDTAMRIQKAQAQAEAEVAKARQSAVKSANQRRAEVGQGLVRPAEASSSSSPTPPQLRGDQLPRVAELGQEAAQTRRSEQEAAEAKASAQDKAREQRWTEKDKKSRERKQKRERAAEMRPHDAYVGAIPPPRGSASHRADATASGSSSIGGGSEDGRATQQELQGVGMMSRASLGSSSSSTGGRELSFAASPIKPTASQSAVVTTVNMDHVDTTVEMGMGMGLGSGSASRMTTMVAIDDDDDGQIVGGGSSDISPTAAAAAAPVAAAAAAAAAGASSGSGYGSGLHSEPEGLSEWLENSQQFDDA